MPKLSAKIEEAFQFASQIHRQQMRKGTTIPYLTHLMSASALVGENGGDEDQMIAALLHDAIEDTDVTKEQIEKRFGNRVAEIVDGCTDTDRTPKPPWRERKESYIEHLKTASPDTKLVSVSDKLHNARCILSDLRSMGPSVWTKFSGSPDEILWYYQSLILAFRNDWKHPLIDELERTVNQIKKLKISGSAQTIPPS